jgi:hypothetical protein
MESRLRHRGLLRPRPGALRLGSPSRRLLSNTRFDLAKPRSAGDRHEPHGIGLMDLTLVEQKNRMVAVDGRVL